MVSDFLGVMGYECAIHRVRGCELLWHLWKQTVGQGNKERKNCYTFDFLQVDKIFGFLTSSLEWMLRHGMSDHLALRIPFPLSHTIKG